MVNFNLAVEPISYGYVKGYAKADFNNKEKHLKYVKDYFGIKSKNAARKILSEVYALVRDLEMQNIESYQTLGELPLYIDRHRNNYSVRHEHIGYGDYHAIVYDIKGNLYKNKKNGDYRLGVIYKSVKTSNNKIKPKVVALAFMTHGRDGEVYTKKYGKVMNFKGYDVKEVLEF